MNTTRSFCTSGKKLLFLITAVVGVFFLLVASARTAPSSNQARRSGWFSKTFGKGSSQPIAPVTGATTSALGSHIESNTKMTSPQDLSSPEIKNEKRTPIDMSSQSWFRLDDGVMGGQSHTDLDKEEDQTSSPLLHFHGTINTNGGGFTSLRTSLPKESLLSSTTVAIRIRYRGDGKTYKLLFGAGERRRMDVPSWQVDLPTTAVANSGDDDQTWQERTIPLADLLPAFGGGPRRQPKDLTQYQLDPSTIQEMGVMLSLRLSDGTPNPTETFGEGLFPFSMQVESITLISSYPY